MNNGFKVSKAVYLLFTEYYFYCWNKCSAGLSMGQSCNSQPALENANGEYIFCVLGDIRFIPSFRHSYMLSCELNNISNICEYMFGQGILWENPKSA